MSMKWNIVLYRMIPSNPFQSPSNSVTDLQPSELSEKVHSGANLKSHKTETKAKVKNPARQNLDIVPLYFDRQQY